VEEEPEEEATAAAGYLVVSSVGNVEHLGDARELGGLGRHGGRVGAGYERGYGAAELGGGGDGGERGRADFAAAVLEHRECA
jgi:hypothetical protein